MTLEEFEKHLKAEGGYYYRSNITVHYYKDEETGKEIYWGNYKGDETEDFETFQELMDAHSWVDIPDSLNDESFPMCRNLPELNQHEIEWEGIVINISHASKWGGVIDHIEVRAAQPIPITETGYKSIFLTDSDIEEAGGAIELVKYLIEKEAESSSWQEYLESSRQKSLF